MTKAIFTVNPESPYDDVEGERYHLAAFMHRGLIMGAFRRMVGFFDKPAQRDSPRRFSAAEVL